MASAKVTTEDVEKVAKLASLTLSDTELKKFPEQFNKTIEVIDQLNEIDTSNIKPTSQVIDLKNVTREDMVDEARILSQTEALSMAKKTHNGYFVVKQVLNK